MRKTVRSKANAPYGLTDMLGTLNNATHGAGTSKEAAEWAMDVGPRLLMSLDAIAFQIKIFLRI